MNFQGTSREGQGMYPFTGLPIAVPTVSSSISTIVEEAQKPIVNQVFELLKDIQESFPGDSEKCKQFLQQMGQPQLLDDFLAIHQQPAENVTPMECNENSGPYYEDISDVSDDEDILGIGPVVVISSDESNHFLAEDLPSQSNDCPSESNDSQGQRNELPSGPSHTTDFLSESKDSLSQRNDSPSENNDNDDLNEDSDDYLLWGHASTLRRSDRVRDKLMFSTNTNVTPKPTRDKRRRNMSESSILSATDTSKSAIKIGVARRLSKRGRPRGKPTSNWEATICGVANEMSMLESSQETMTASENSGTAIEALCGSPLFFSTLTSDSSLIQPKRVDIRDLPQKRTKNSLTPILCAESEVRGDDKPKECNPGPIIAGSENIKSGVGRGRKKKNLNFLQMLSTLGKRAIPVRGRPKKQKTLESKNTVKSSTNAWRQKQVKKALFSSPKNARLKGPKDFFAKVRKSIGDTEDYRQFLRCVSMLNEENISSNVFLTLVYPILNDFPDLYNWLQKFLMANKTLTCFTATPRIHTDLDSETIVVNKLPKLGKSYRSLPPHYVQPICSGRTDLCNSVLNDVYVCVPPHSRGGPNARMARKLKITNKRVDTVSTQTEEGRYEVDLMIEIGNTCIIHFERVLKKMSAMSQVMLNTFELGTLLGGHSQIIPSFIIQLYGKTVGPTIVAALNKKPADSVPVVLPRMRGKVEEWREAQKKFNQKWRDQVEHAIASQINDDVVIIE